MSEYRIRRATTVADVRALIEMRLEAEDWLHERGIPQWTDTRRALGNLLDGVESGATWMLQDEAAETVGTVTLAGADLDFWTEADDLASALYMYKLMVRRSHKGRGLGDMLMDWACQRAEVLGRRWLRLDCWRENRELRAYYEARSFRHVRTVTVSGRGSGALYQRDVYTRVAGTLPAVDT